MKSKYLTYFCPHCDEEVCLREVVTGVVEDGLIEEVSGNCAEAKNPERGYENCEVRLECNGCNAPVEWDRYAETLERWLERHQYQPPLPVDKRKEPAKPGSEVPQPATSPEEELTNSNPELLP